VVHHQLYDDPRVLAKVLEADHPHDVGRVLGVGLFAELVGQDEAGGGLQGVDFYESALAVTYRQNLTRLK
jgi:hypothetical protein